MKKLKMHAIIVFEMLLVFAVFFGGWELFYPQICGTLLSQTRIILYLGYTIALITLLNVYSALAFGKAKIGELIYSQSLSEVIIAGLAYIVAVANASRFINPLPFLLILFVQGVINFIFSFWGHNMYYRLHKPKKTVLIYRDDDDLSKLEEVGQFSQRFSVEKYIKNPANIDEILPELDGCEVVFVAGIEATLRNGIAKYCVEKNVMGYIHPHVGDVIMMSAEHMHMFSVPLMRIRRSSPNPEYLALKRLFDIVASLFGILLTGIFMLITAIAIKLYDGGPVLYKQVRLTKDGKQFKIYKFRSMKVDAEKDGVARLASDNDDRITPVGHIIRACRLDELPQLFNILKGDMSVVGPRPERPEIASDYEKVLPAFNLRLQCKAGLTGYAQVYGRYNTEPKDKLMMDLMYIQNMSFFEDIKLCFYTVKILFMKESTQGVAEGQVTALNAAEAEPNAQIEAEVETEKETRETLSVK